MKTALWLYLFLFVAFFDLHAQYPMLTPFAVSLGAAPSFIGLVMGMYSLTHLPGNLIAGYSIDRFGSRYFIAGSLVFAGVLLLFQAQVTDPWQLLYIRSFSGFVLAFLSPACMSMLAKLALNPVHQGKLMAGNGLVHTIASVVSPAAGAWLAATIGFNKSFEILGWVLLATGAISVFFLRDRPHAVDAQSAAAPSHHSAAVPEPLHSPAAAEPVRLRWSVFMLPIGLACAQGILSFELPLMAKNAEQVLQTGILFSVVSIGALVTLSLLVLNRYLPYKRTIAGTMLLALAYYGLASAWPFPLIAVLFVIGMAKGIVFPAMSSFLLQLSGPSRYGRTFSVLSISSSIGAFLGPVVAGAIRSYVSPYFLAFLALMLALIFLFPHPSYKANWHVHPVPPPAGT